MLFRSLFDYLEAAERRSQAQTQAAPASAPEPLDLRAERPPAGTASEYDHIGPSNAGAFDDSMRTSPTSVSREAATRDTAASASGAAHTRTDRETSEDTTMANLDNTLPPIKVVGVGGGGSNAVNRMISARLPGVQYVALNTDMQALQHCQAEMKVRIGDRDRKSTRLNSSHRT